MKIAHKENGEKEENEVEEEEKEKNCKRKSHLASFGAKKNLVGFSCKWDHIWGLEHEENKKMKIM